MNYKDYGLSIYDEIAVKTIVAYLLTLEESERQKTLDMMQASKEVFASVLEKSIEQFRKDYELQSRVSTYYKYIGKEYLERLQTVKSEAYLEDVPQGVYQYILDCLK